VEVFIKKDLNPRYGFKLINYKHTNGVNMALALAKVIRRYIAVLIIALAMRAPRQNEGK